MEAMPCRRQRAGSASGAEAGRQLRFAERESSSPSPESSDGSSGGCCCEGGGPCGGDPAPPLGAQLKLLPMNDQIRELQTIIRDR